MTRRAVQEQHQASLARRVCVGGLASGLVLLQVVGLAHFLLVAHEICPEHGEFQDINPLHEARGVASLAASSHTALAGSLPDRQHGLGHEHCATVLHQRARAFAPLSALAGALELVVRLGAVAAPEARSSVALLFLAPKGSPPSCS